METVLQKAEKIPVERVIKGAILITVLAAVFFAGRWIYKTFVQNTASAGVSTAKDDVSKFQSQGQQQTYPDAQYNFMADAIYEGMRYSSISDDYNSVVITLKKMMNNLDVALTVVAYGLRQEYNFGIPDGQPRNLFEQFSNDLDGTSYQQQVNTDWASKNISYRV